MTLNTLLLYSSVNKYVDAVEMLRVGFPIRMYFYCIYLPSTEILTNLWFWLNMTHTPLIWGIDSFIYWRADAISMKFATTANSFCWLPSDISRPCRSRKYSLSGKGLTILFTVEVWTRFYKLNSSFFTWNSCYYSLCHRQRQE